MRESFGIFFLQRSPNDGRSFLFNIFSMYVLYFGRFVKVSPAINFFSPPKKKAAVSLEIDFSWRRVKIKLKKTDRSTNF